MKRSIYFSIFFLILFVLPTATSAMTVLEKTGSIFKGDPFYNPSTDSVFIYTNDIYYGITFNSYQVSSFDKLITHKELYPSDYGWKYFIGAHFSCNRAVEAFFYDYYGSQVGYLKLIVDDLVNPSCDSGAIKDVTDPNVGGGTGNPPTNLDEGKEFFIHDIADPNEFISNGPVYDSVKDSIHFDFNGNDAYYDRLNKIVIDEFSDNGFSSSVNSTTLFPSDFGLDFFNGLDISGNGFYKVHVFDDAGNELMEIDLGVEGVKKSNEMPFDPVAYDKQGKPIDKSPTDSNGAGSGGSNSCNENKLCECMQTIRDAVNSNGTDISNVINTVGDEINNSINSNGEKLDSVLDQLTPTMEPRLPSLPDEPNLIDPNPKKDAVTDYPTFFKDEGDANSPPALPVAPDPSACWKDLNDNDVCSDDVGQRDNVLDRDPIIEKDLVLDKDPVNTKDDVLNKDPVSSKDSVFDKDPVNDKDSVIVKDPVLVKDPVNDKDSVPVKDSVLNQDPVVSPSPDWTS